jgi:hypothetical protein
MVDRHSEGRQKTPPPLFFVGDVSAVAILEFQPPASMLSLLLLSQKHTTHCIPARSAVDFLFFDQRESCLL